MANEITRNDAIKSLKPSAIYALLGDVVTWLDEVQTEPTTAEIDAEIVRLQAEYDAQAYARSRAAEYPPIADQLDDIYHNGIDAWKATIKVTKDKYPK